jgi:hypothetical protein
VTALSAKGSSLPHLDLGLRGRSTSRQARVLGWISGASLAVSYLLNHLIMASHDIEKDIGIAEPNDRSSSKDEEKPELANIEDVERQKELVEARLSRFTKEEEEAVIRKLDWHLMPLIFVLYSLSVLDRSNLGNAKIAGMQKDINIAGNRYAWLGTIFYISCKNSRPRCKDRD